MTGRCNKAGFQGYGAAVHSSMCSLVAFSAAAFSEGRTSLCRVSNVSLMCCLLSLFATPSAHAAADQPSVSVSGATTSGQTPASSAKAAGAQASASQAAAVKLLDGINAAARHLDYQGSFVFQRNATVQSSRIVHFVDGHDQYQKVDSLDGAARSVVQHNDDVFTFLQKSRTVILDQRKSQDNFPALLSGGSAHVLDVYRASIIGADRVAGIDCRIVALTPNDDLRFAYRLSVDPASGLLIRAQTLDSDGNVLEQVAFSQVQIGLIAADSRKAIRDSLHQWTGWKLVRAPVEAVSMEAAGWTLSTLSSDVPGFRKVLELRRPMAAREPGAAPVPVDQAVFSDGVTAVSLFIEPIDKSDRKPGEGRSGATHLLAEPHGDFWVTLIGEVPALTLRRFAAAIQYHPPAASPTRPAS